MILPPRFAELKKQLWRDGMLQSWGEILDELKVATEEIPATGPSVRYPRAHVHKIRDGDCISIDYPTGTF